MAYMMAAGSQALNNASIRNQGGQAGFLGGPGAIDGSAQSFWNLADPFNTTGHASSGHALSNILDPGNVFAQNQAANPLGQNGANAANGTQTTMPNLGAASMIPTMPGGNWGASTQGSGPFNAMANQSAGQLFTPTGINIPTNTGQPASNYATPIIGNGNPLPGQPGSGIGPWGMHSALPNSYNPMINDQGPSNASIHNTMQQAISNLSANQIAELNKMGASKPGATNNNTNGSINNASNGGYNPNGGPR